MIYRGFPGGSGRPGFDPWVGKIPLEKGMAIHSSIPVWRIPWTQEEPGGLQSMRSQRVGHDEWLSTDHKQAGTVMDMIVNDIHMKVPLTLV